MSALAISGWRVRELGCISPVCSSENKEVSNGSTSSLKAAGSGWSVACTTVEEWNQVIESITGSKHAETKRLLRALQGTSSKSPSPHP